MTSGSCLCKAIRYRTDQKVGDIFACHCTQCRKQSGHFAAATPMDLERMELTGELRWYQSSDVARRGFCGTCGSTIFWQEIGGETWLLAGTIDAPTGGRLAGNIYYADKGDYYRAGAEEPCFARFTDEEKIER